MLELQKSKVTGEVIHVQRMPFSVEGGSVENSGTKRQNAEILQTNE